MHWGHFLLLPLLDIFLVMHSFSDILMGQINPGVPMAP